MNITIKKIHLEFRKATEILEFPRLNYFYGPIGSGKSSIARLIDYCFGAHIEWTWALQQELISAALEIDLNGVPLTLYRAIDTNLIIATWIDDEEQLQVSIPAREAKGEVLPDTGVEVLSDLIFYLLKITPPKVRRKRGLPEEHLERVSFRDLFRFCYLDQEGMDSSLFKLNSDNYAVQRKSVDTLRYLLGYHQEQLAELESRLQAIREDRLARQSGAEALKKALFEAGFEDAFSLDNQIEDVKNQIDHAKKAALKSRDERDPVPHAVDSLRLKARNLTQELAANEEAIAELSQRIDDLTRYDNELQMLSVRFQRTSVARSIIGGVNFKTCPRCTNTLPQRPPELCNVCGQPEHVLEATNALSEDVVKTDLQNRRIELKETISRMIRQLKRLRHEGDILKSDKSFFETEFTKQMQTYDSIFLSRAIESERTIATLEQKLASLIHNRKLPDILEEQQDLSIALLGDEAEARAQLDGAKKLAFQDTKNIGKLAELLLDCLLRVKFPDVKASHHVSIDPANFEPQVMFSERGEFTVLSFANAGSGGMKSLFKTCYALAIHRLCSELKAPLPNFLIIDTATKNVSSIENPEVVGSFYKLIYELAENELKETQFIIIDNEYVAPKATLSVPINVRHMMNGSEENPPLIPYLFSAVADDNPNWGDFS